MSALVFLALAVYAVGRFFPDTKAGRMIRDLLGGRWRKALPYAVVAMGVALLLLSAPELAPLAAGLDLSLMADILLAASIVIVQLNFRRMRQAMRHLRRAAVQALLRPRTRRQRRPAMRRRPPPGDDDAPAGLVLILRQQIGVRLLYS